MTLARFFSVGRLFLRRELLPVHVGFIRLRYQALLNGMNDEPYTTQPFHTALFLYSIGHCTDRITEDHILPERRLKWTRTSPESTRPVGAIVANERRLFRIFPMPHRVMGGVGIVCSPRI